MAKLQPEQDIGLSSALRAPLQGRSRESYDRMMEATEKLLAERGDGEFTLSDVSKAGKVSIGSIYNRFESKDALLHAVQLRVLERVNRGMSARMEEAVGTYRDLDHLVGRLVEAIAEGLRHHAPQMAALMRIATNDEHVSATGKKFYKQTVEDYSAALLAHREEIHRLDPEAAVAMSYRILYAAIARYLGFGSARDASWEGTWDDLKRDLAIMIASFLRTP